MDPATFRPSKGKVVFVFVMLVLFLGASTALFLLGYSYRKKYHDMVKKDAARQRAIFLTEHARHTLEEADRLSRQPGQESTIKELCQIAMESASGGAAQRPDLEEPYYVRGRALEMLYHFEEAEADYSDALKNYAYSFASLRRGLLGLRRFSRMLLIGPAPKSAAPMVDRASEDLRLHTFHLGKFAGDEAQKALPTLAVGFLYGEYPETVQAYDFASSMNPTEWMCGYILGLALFQLDRREEALKAFDAASAICPYAAEPHAFRGVVLRKLNRLEEALESLSTALRLDDQFIEAVYARAQVLMDARRYDDAKGDFDHCLKVRPTMTEARLQSAIAGYEWWRRTGRSDAALIEKALEDLERVIAEAPENVDARLARAKAYVERGELERALPDVNAVLDRNPKREDALKIRAKIHVQRKNWAAADQDLSTIGDLRERARVRALAGRFDDALADLDLLLLKDAKDTSVILERGRIQILAGRLEDATATLDKLSETHPNLPRVKVLRAEILLAKKDPQGALKLAEEAVTSDPQLGEGYLVRGFARLALGEKAGAQADFEEAVKHNPALADRVPR